jgi:hypothetical protein
MFRALENISATGSVSYHYTLCKLMSQLLFILHAWYTSPGLLGDTFDCHL